MPLEIESTKTCSCHADLTDIIRVEDPDDVQQPNRPTQLPEKLMEELMFNGREGRSEVEEDSRAVFLLQGAHEHHTVDR